VFKYLLFSLLCLALATHLPALEEIIPSENELPELMTDQLDATNSRWLVQPDSLSTAAGQPLIILPAPQIRTYCTWSPENRQLIWKQGFYAGEKNSDVFLNLHDRIRDGLEPEDHLRLVLRYQASDPHQLLRTVILGEYNVRFGLGLVTGSASSAWNKAASKEGVGLSPAVNPLRPSYFGTALQLGRQVVYRPNQTFRLSPRLTLWHTYWFQESKFLPGQAQQYHYSHNFSFLEPINAMTDKILMEKIVGISLSSPLTAKTEAGILYYYQQYYYLLGTKPMINFNQVCSFYGIWKTGPGNLTSEAALSEQKPHLAVSFEPVSRAFPQRFSYVRRSDAAPLLHSYVRQTFGQTYNYEEINWDARSPISSGWIITSRIALRKNLSATPVSRWQDRSILSAEKNTRKQKFSLSWYQFRRSAVAEVDTSWQELLPTQNRLKAEFSQTLTDHWTGKLAGQYQHYRNISLIRNGFRQDIVLQGNYHPFDLSLKCSTWSMLRSTSSLVTSADETILSQVSGSDTALHLTLKYHWRKHLACSLTANRPLLHPENQTYSFSLSTSQ